MGQSILLADNFRDKIQNIQKGKSGKILPIAFNMDKQSFQIVNIYGPIKSCKREHFYQSLTNYITNISNIVGGDFTLDPMDVLQIKPFSLSFRFSNQKPKS